MLIIHCIKSTSGVYDLYFREKYGSNLIWFAVLPGECNPNEHKAGILKTYNLCEPDFPFNDCSFYIYEKRS